MRRSWPGIVFVTIIVQLALWNAWVIKRNQTLFEPHDRLAIRPKSIEAVALEQPMFVVRTTYVTYHRLARHYAGKTLVIAQQRAAHRFALERLSRLVVEVVPEPMRLPPAVMERLVKTQLAATWELDSGTALGIIAADESVERFVLVEREDRLLELLMPESLYKQELAALASRP